MDLFLNMFQVLIRFSFTVWFKAFSAIKLGSLSSWERALRPYSLAQVIWD